MKLRDALLLPVSVAFFTFVAAAGKGSPENARWFAYALAFEEVTILGIIIGTGVLCSPMARLFTEKDMVFAYERPGLRSSISALWGIAGAILMLVVFGLGVWSMPTAHVPSFLPMAHWTPLEAQLSAVDTGAHAGTYIHMPQCAGCLFAPGNWWAAIRNSPPFLALVGWDVAVTALGMAIVALPVALWLGATCKGAQS